MKKFLLFILATLLAVPAMSAKVCRPDTDSDVPAGSIIMMPVEHMPYGYLLCDGSAVSRTAYARLFSVIGTTYGDGDGSTTFNLPDFQGMFLRGAGGNAAAAGTKQLESAPEISGSVGITGNYVSSGAFRRSTNETLGLGGGNLFNGGWGNTTFYASRSNAAYGRRDEVAPANYSVYYYIRY
ncbi:MAG: phage tail protein [Rickettsiales bacterium]|nr:phage tail protein [Rickettsiales bacterium]